MNKQRLADLAAETQKIVKQGYYLLSLAPGSTAREVTISRPDGPTSALIHPDDWPDIKGVAESRAKTLVGPTTVAVRAVTTLQALQQLNVHVDEVTGVVTEGDRSGVMVLNFASARNPGGGWLRGTDAQEESLARASDLAESLERWPRYYRVNRESDVLYTDYAIWSPRVVFFRDDTGYLTHPYRANVLTIPAPNLSKADSGELKVAAAHVLNRRINNILAAAVFYHQHYLVLGAWGCGVFQNDPLQVARLFQDHLSRWRGCFQHVVFAIHDTSKDQRVLNQFRDVFE